MDSTISQTALTASGVVGTWTHDHRTGTLSLSGRLAGMAGLDAARAAHGLSLGDFLERAHPTDRNRIRNYFHAVAVVDGPVEAEFRLRDLRGGTRTLLLRGRIEPDGVGLPARGRGIAIDRTEENGGDMTRAYQVVNQMAAQAITLRGLAQALRNPSLVAQVDRLMQGIGVELARHVPPPEDDCFH
ncbi:MAG: diguanylate cyclase [Parafilimonas terrae]|jgi:hypothetical protein|nr:diguanylate cyclase [Parafilimonas terrae]